jgi:hypothetical protein
MPAIKNVMAIVIAPCACSCNCLRLHVLVEVPPPHASRTSQPPRGIDSRLSAVRQSGGRGPFARRKIVPPHRGCGRWQRRGISRYVRPRGGVPGRRTAAPRHQHGKGRGAQNRPQPRALHPPRCGGSGHRRCRRPAPPQRYRARRRKPAGASDSLVLGCRTFRGEVPLRSRIGNVATSAIMHALMGRKISDTQTGLRGIPTAFALRILRLEANGYEFELEMLIAAHKWGVRPGGRAHPHHLPAGQSVLAFQPDRGLDEDLLHPAALRLRLAVHGAAGQPDLHPGAAPGRFGIAVADSGPDGGAGLQLYDGAQFGFLFAPAAQVGAAEIPAAGAGQRNGVVRRHPSALGEAGNQRRFRPS